MLNSLKLRLAMYIASVVSLLSLFFYWKGRRIIWTMFWTMWNISWTYAYPRRSRNSRILFKL